MLDKEFLTNYDPDKFDRISFSVDNLIFGIDTKMENTNYRKLDIHKLAVLLVKRNEAPFINCWSLPGGFVAKNETLDAAAKRILRTKIGAKNLYIEQLKTFGDIHRDPRMRIISCAYMSLVNSNGFVVENGNAIEDCAWFVVEFNESESIMKLSHEEETITFKVNKDHVKNGMLNILEYRIDEYLPMAFDHPNFILQGLLRLRAKIDYTDVAFNLVPEYFTITQLQQIHEIILGKKLIPSAFRRTVAKKIVETGEFTKDKGHRPSQLFKYKQSSGPT